MKKKIADELKECAAIAKSARNEAIGLQLCAQVTECTLRTISDLIETLPKFEEIDVLNRRHYLCQRIRKEIADIILIMNYAGIASEAFKKEMVDLEKKIEGALRQVEAEIQHH